MMRFWQRRWRVWMDRRLAVATEITLDQRRIFIMPTRQGVLFAMMIAALFVGGINFANNLMLGLAFWLGSLYVVLILHTYRNLAGVWIRGERPESGQQGGRVGWTCCVGDAAGRPHHALQLDQGDLSWSVDLPVGASKEYHQSICPPRRGLVQPARLRVRSHWPFGLVQAWSWVRLDVRIPVWPRPLPGAPDPLWTQAHHEAASSLQRAGHEDFQGLAAWREGESFSQVAWKQVARTGQWLRQERSEPLAAGVIRIRFEDDPDPDQERVLARMCARVMQQVGTYSLELPGLALGPARGEEHQHRCLLALANWRAIVYRMPDAG